MYLQILCLSKLTLTRDYFTQKYYFYFIQIFKVFKIN